MRPKADSLGEKAPVHPSGLKGREKSLLDPGRLVRLALFLFGGLAGYSQRRALLLDELLEPSDEAVELVSLSPVQDLKHGCAVGRPDRHVAVLFEGDEYQGEGEERHRVEQPPARREEIHLRYLQEDDQEDEPQPERVETYAEQLVADPAAAELVGEVPQLVAPFPLRGPVGRPGGLDSVEEEIDGLGAKEGPLLVGGEWLLLRLHGEISRLALSAPRPGS